jgi:hypothetical protein
MKITVTGDLRKDVDKSKEQKPLPTVEKAKFTCNHCGEQDTAETYLIFRHMRTKHPQRWEEILAEVEEERKNERK